MAVTKVWQDPVAYITPTERRSVHRFVTQAVIDLRWQLAPILESLDLDLNVNQLVPKTEYFTAYGVRFCLIYTSTEPDYINYKLSSFVQLAVGLDREEPLLRNLLEGLL